MTDVASGFLSENGLRGNDSDSKPLAVAVGAGPSSQIINFTTVLSCGANESWPSILTSGNGGLPAADVDFRLAVDVYLVGALCAIGFFGNAFTVAVLRSDADGRDNSTNWLLQTLAFVDSVYLAASLFIQPLKALYDTDRLEKWVTLEFVYPHIEPYIWPIASISQTLTVWIVLLVTVDRFVAVCRPLKRHFRSIERAKTAAGVCSLLAVVYNVPLFFERQVTPYHQCQTATAAAITMTGNAANASSLYGGQTILAALTHNTPLGNSFLYFVVYKTACYFLFRSAGPLAIIAYINVRLLKALRLRRRRMAAHGRCRQQHGGGASVTAMLIAVVTVFVVCELPDLALRMTASLVSIYYYSLTVSSRNSVDDGSSRRMNDDQGQEFLLRANSVANALLVFNSSVNFIVYCVVGNKFRDIFVRFCRSALTRCWPINIPGCRRNLSTGNYISDGIIRDLATVGCGYEGSGLAVSGMTSQTAEMTSGTTLSMRPRLGSPSTATADGQYAVHGYHRGHHHNHHHCGRHLSFASTIPAASMRRGTEGLVTLWPPLTRYSGQRGPFAPRSPTIDNTSSSRIDKTHLRIDRSSLSTFNRERVAPVCSSDSVESSASIFPVEVTTVTKAEVLRVDIAAAVKRTDNVSCNVDSGVKVADPSES